jgi:hypothetical protein
LKGRGGTFSSIGCGLLAVLLPALAGARPEAAPRPWIWWEAEAPTATNFPDQNPFAPSDDKIAQALSGGRWIGAGLRDKVLFAEYQVVVHNGGPYDFYARKFWQHGPFRWRFDDQPWRECGRAALLDGVSLAKYVEVNWVRLGALRLGRGTHTLRIEVDPGADGAAFDCFLLIDGPFVARGKLKPDQRYDVVPPEGWFVFDPDADPFRSSAALDLRSLNETVAGAGGFIQARGDGFAHEKTGEPIRFWGVNTGHEILNDDDAGMDRYARRLAKAGVNAVRLGGPLWKDDDPSSVDRRKLDRIQRLAAALKSQGIYLCLTTFFPFWWRPQASAGFEGYAGDKESFALAFFNPHLQEAQRNWWKQLLEAPNPYTGQPLNQDPTLAFVEIINEDGLLFWTFVPYETVPAPQMLTLEKLFGRWLARRYGTVNAALTRWRDDSGETLWRRWFDEPIRGDVPRDGRVGLMSLQDLLKHRNLRAQDTAAFLSELQREYFDQMYAYIKHDLGFKGLVAGSNWVTADPRLLGPLDKWSNAGCDYLDRHGYYGGPHEGERAAYLISEGDRYDDASALLFETGRNGARSFELPIMDLGYNDKPSTISEISWVPPNRYRADMPLVAAAYGDLQGTDGFYFFTTSDTDWPTRLTKFTLADPVGMGQFPATALIFRKGLVRTAAVAARIDTRLEDLEALRGIPISAAQNLDELRKKGVRDASLLERNPDAQFWDPLAFLVGRVQVDVGELPAAAHVSDLTGLIDHRRQRVSSSTGELAWDYASGLVTIDAPQVEGATGFLGKAGTISLSDVSLQSPLAYGSIVVVSLDDRPIRTSKRLLLQVMSEDANHGWNAPGTGIRPIVSTGEPPILVKNLAGSVSLKRSDAASMKIRALDWNGYSTAAPPAKGASPVVLSPTTFYYIIEK